ncbi:MAG: hypothetical protein LH650_08945, partial [Chloroflexi bacterium]|nr:hypothetical protein [Chloroflexota bacterium]
RKGMPVSETHALGTDAPVLVKQLYDGDMRHVGTVDANGGLWRVTRDKSGNILTSTDPLGRTATMTWNDRNDPLSVTSPMGLRTDVEYDDKGLVTRVIKAVDTPDEAVTTVSRDDPEHPTDVTSITDPLGSVTRFGYDAAGHLVSITDPFGGVTRMEVNGLGWVMATTDPTRARTTLIRDARGQVTSITDPLGLLTTATWDPAGALSSVSDPMDSVTALVHDAAGRISGATLADGLTQDVARDELGDVIGRSDASGSVMTATYDPLRRVSSVADPLGNETRVAYDPAGNVLSTTNALGETTRFSWDAAHQLLAMDYDDATPDVTFTYDLDGRRTSMTDGTGTTTYEYDARDRIVSVTDGAGDTVGQSWDLRGALTGLAYPDGLSVTYTYDALGRMISVSDSVGSTFAYDAAGRLLESRLGDGSVTTRTYDARGSVLAIGGRPLDLVYARDPLGRVAAVTSGGQTVQTHHDVRGRLTSVGDETFEFDLAGALTSVRGATMTHDTAGRLVQMAGDADATTFTFDDAGRRIAQDGASPVEYAYDQVGRLTSVGESTWTYDGDGLRRSVTDADGVTAHFSWLTTGGRPMLLSDGTSRFIYGPGGMPLAQVGDGGARQWFHTDQAGSVRALTADDGSVVGTFAFDAYGLATDRTGTATTRLGFQGNYTEADSGLQYLLARVYDPGTAQFLTVDPLVWRTLEPYAFAAGDPLTYGDPTGLDVALAGHGEWNVTHGMTTVPEGTTVIFHAPAGWGITDDYGKLVEGGGSGGFEERFGPGSLIPNYLLSPPAGLSVLKSSRTVSSPTRLKDLLWPGQGNVSWAACRYMWGGSYDPASPEQTLHMWVREHGYSTVHASDYQALGGWGTDSQVIFGDTQLKKFGHFGGGYQIAEPVVLMPGV